MKEIGNGARTKMKEEVIEKTMFVKLPKLGMKVLAKNHKPRAITIEPIIIPITEETARETIQFIFFFLK
jgi:hypothetical protein